MRVVVSGGSGFIGSHVMRMLAELGHSPVNLDRDDRTNPVEIRSSSLIARHLDGAEAIVHCAAKADVRRNWEPGELSALVEQNVSVTLAVLDAARATKTVKSFVFVSTGAVYADEFSPYAASKLSGEVWARAYAAKAGWRLCIVRPAACYGTGYRHGHIADFVKMAHGAGKVTSLTAGNPRDGLHVEDCAGWLARLAVEDNGRRAGTFYLRGHGEQWGCRDTVRVMGVSATWGYYDHGWIGDTKVSLPSDLPCGRSLESGVRASLLSLGWVTP